MDLTELVIGASVSDPNTESASTKDFPHSPWRDYYWRSFNTKNTPKPSVAQALASFLGVQVSGASSGAHIEVSVHNLWITSNHFKNQTGRWPGPPLPLRLQTRPRRLRRLPSLVSLCHEGRCGPFDYVGRGFGHHSPNPSAQRPPCRSAANLAAGVARRRASQSSHGSQTRTTMNSVIALLLLLVEMLAAWGLWIAEVRWVKGWAGLAWLSGFNWSALPICPLIGVAKAIFTSRKADLKERTTFALSVAGACLFAFTIARWAFFEMFSGGLGSVIISDRPMPMLLLVIALLLVAIVPTAAANRWLGPVHFWTAIGLGLSLLLVVPLSLATTKLLPAPNGNMDAIHAIKMGTRFSGRPCSFLSFSALAANPPQARATPKVHSCCGKMSSLGQAQITPTHPEPSVPPPVAPSQTPAPHRQPPKSPRSARHFP